jgi:CheY-like chemotaxis protein
MGVGLSAVEQEPELLDGDEGSISETLAIAGRTEPPQERLGRRVAEIAGIARLLGAEPDAVRYRDDLRRRLHALSAGARLLRFAKLAEELAASEAVLSRAADRSTISAGELAEIRAMLERVPALAWGQASVGETTMLPSRGASPRSGRSRAASLSAVRVPLGPADGGDPSPRVPLTVLVVGPPQIADALTKGAGEPIDRAQTCFDVERAAECEGAPDLARALAPDVVVVDADRPGALPLCEALSSDPLTELVPIIVLGRFGHVDAAAPFVALGVARALPKPVSPDVLRRACADAAATYVRREIRRAPLGELTVDELGARLTEELRRGLGDAAVASGRGTRVNLGEGSDVLAALWGAVARIRDLVTIHSEGDVRFAPSGPEGALPLAPWLGSEETAAARARLEVDRPGALEADLARKVIVVADDDPAVTWFLSGVFQAAGAIVYEAHDGIRALQIAFRFTPDLVISDILMPGLDGFALCHALKRDLVLRDVPVILLSWKEDLLQRVRELGVDADGYLRKEVSAAVIVQRVREVLAARRRIAERIAGGASPQTEVRGRLDGLTTRTLLSLVCAHRPASTVTVRDASFLYEVDIRDGRPVRATRTAPDGSFERGALVLAALLGVGAGRFVVAPAPAHAFAAELVGSLDEQLLPRIALARAAQRLLSDVALIGVERVELSEERMTLYAAATPEPARSLLHALAAGASPRALIMSGQAAPRLVEDVLCDAAAHGAITAIIGPDGQELLEEAIEQEIGILRGEPVPRPPVAVPMLNLGPAAEPWIPAPTAVVALPASHAKEDPPTPPATASNAVPISPEIPKVASAATAKLLTPPAPVALIAPTAKEPAREPSRAPASARPPLSLASQTPPPVLPSAAPPTPRPTSIVPKVSPPPAMSTADESPVRFARRPSAFVPNSAAAPAPARKESTKDSRMMWLLFAVAGIVFAVGARVSRDRQDAARHRRRSRPHRDRDRRGPRAGHAATERRREQGEPDPARRVRAPRRGHGAARARHARGGRRRERYDLHRRDAGRNRAGRQAGARAEEGSL